MDTILINILNRDIDRNSNTSLSIDAIDSTGQKISNFDRHYNGGDRDSKCRNLDDAQSIRPEYFILGRGPKTRPGTYLCIYKYVHNQIELIRSYTINVSTTTTNKIYSKI